MLRIKLACAALAASSLSACQSVPAWKDETSFPFRRPIVQAMCEISSRFNAIRELKTFPNSFYVLTITLESKRRHAGDVAISTSYRTTDAGDDYFRVGLGSGALPGLGASAVASRLSTTPVTFALTDLGSENKKFRPYCDGSHATDTRADKQGKFSSLGLDQWFEDVMLAAPVGIPDGVTTTLYLERGARGSVFPGWRFVRGFVDPSAAADYSRYDQLKVEVKTQSAGADRDAGAVTVNRGNGSTTKVPTTSTESYRNLMQQRIQIVPLQ
jgi:hypothetical protein